MKSKIIVAISGFFLALTAYAQFGALATPQNTVTIELIPRFSGPVKDFPGPNEDYRAEIRSTTADISRSTVTIIRNGKTVARGLGVKSYDFTTGPSGSRETLTASITTPAGTRAETTRLFTINDVDLLWFANTTIPFWYKGKALASPSSSVRLVAFPEVRGASGALIPASQLVYQWTRNGNNIPAASGAGRQTYAFITDLVAAAQTEITLTVTDLNQTTGAQTTIRVPLTDQRARFYAEHPLEGTITSHTVSNFPMQNDASQNFRAVPFFFSKNAPLSYDWFIDGETASAAGSPDLIRIVASQRASGVAAITASIKNLRAVLQQAAGSFTIHVQ